MRRVGLKTAWLIREMSALAARHWRVGDPDLATSTSSAGGAAADGSGPRSNDDRVIHLPPMACRRDVAGLGEPSFALTLPKPLCAAPKPPASIASAIAHEIIAVFMIL